MENDEKWVVGLGFCKEYDINQEIGTLSWLFFKVICEGPKEYAVTPEYAKYYRFAKPLTMNGVVKMFRALADQLEKQNDGR